MNNARIEEDEDMVPNTPVVKDDTKRDKTDPNEFLLGDDDIASEDDTDVSEEYHEN